MSLRQTVKRQVFDRLFHRRRLYVLNYHIICAPGDDSPDYLGTKTPVELFRAKIEWLGERYRFVDLHSWIAGAGIRERAGHCVAITFDDGHGSVLEHALPVLEEHGIPATLFINTGYWDQDRRICWSNAGGRERLAVGEKEMSLTEAARQARETDDPQVYRTYTRAIEEFMSAGEAYGRGYIARKDLRLLESDVLKVGMHGHLHHRHAMFDAAWEAGNIRTNERELRTLRNFVPLFAFPFGTKRDAGAGSAGLCRDLGLTPVFHNGGYNVATTSDIRRIPADGRDACQLIQTQSPFLHKYDVSK